MRSETEVQRVHDMLSNLVEGAVPELAREDRTRRALRSCLDVLCWVLEHDNNHSFATLVVQVERIVQDLGYVLVREADAPRTVHEGGSAGGPAARGAGGPDQVG